MMLPGILQKSMAETGAPEQKQTATCSKCHADIGMDAAQEGGSLLKNGLDTVLGQFPIIGGGRTPETLPPELVEPDEETPEETPEEEEE